MLWKIHDDSPCPKKTDEKSWISKLGPQKWNTSKIRSTNRFEWWVVSLEFGFEANSLESLSSKKGNLENCVEAPCSSIFFPWFNYSITVPSKKKMEIQKNAFISKKESSCCIQHLHDKKQFPGTLSRNSKLALPGRATCAWGRWVSLVGGFRQPIWKIYARQIGNLMKSSPNY